MTPWIYNTRRVTFGQTSLLHDGSHGCADRRCVFYALVDRPGRHGPDVGPYPYPYPSLARYSPQILETSEVAPRFWRLKKGPPWWAGPWCLCVFQAICGSGRLDGGLTRWLLALGGTIGRLYRGRQPSHRVGPPRPGFVFPMLATSLLCGVDSRARS